MLTFALGNPPHSGNSGSEREMGAGAGSRRAPEMEQFAPQIAQLIDVAVIVLIPMIPALILYAVLPSRATVSGPFKGLNIRLQGAFGGYFLLVLVVVAVVVEGRLSEERRLSETRLSANLYPKYETWTVEGSFKFPHAVEEQSLLALKILLAPQKGETIGGLDKANMLMFTVDIPIRRTGPDPKSYEFPFHTIIVDHPDFFPENLKLNPSDEALKPDVSIKGRKIIFMESIEFTDRSALPGHWEEVEATAP